MVINFLITRVLAIFWYNFKFSVSFGKFFIVLSWWILMNHWNYLRVLGILDSLWRQGKCSEDIKITKRGKILLKFLIFLSFFSLTIFTGPPKTFLSPADGLHERTQKLLRYKKCFVDFLVASRVLAMIIILLRLFNSFTFSTVEVLSLWLGVFNWSGGQIC